MQIPGQLQMQMQMPMKMPMPCRCSTRAHLCAIGRVRVRIDADAVPMQYTRAPMCDRLNACIRSHIRSTHTHSYHLNSTHTTHTHACRLACRLQRKHRHAHDPRSHDCAAPVRQSMHMCSDVYAYAYAHAHDAHVHRDADTIVDADAAPTTHTHTRVRMHIHIHMHIHMHMHTMWPTTSGSFAARSRRSPLRTRTAALMTMHAHGSILDEAGADAD